VRFGAPSNDRIERIWVVLMARPLSSSAHLPTFDFDKERVQVAFFSFISFISFIEHILDEGEPV
jgi:hypothetical protein